MQLSDFEYILPEELIAQKPVSKRIQSRMMVLDRASKKIEHKYFFDIVDLLTENDVLVLNNTKVIPARLLGQKLTGANVEVFLLKEHKSNAELQSTPNPNVMLKPFQHSITERPCDPETSSERRDNLVEASHKQWEALLKPSKRINQGNIIKISDELMVKTLARLDGGKWLVELIYEGEIHEILNKSGNIPLPPYIERKIHDEKLKKFDSRRYQTVFAKHAGSVAAPTAGLHFSRDILSKLKKKGVQICYVTLDVGLGTFKPVKCENVPEHRMDSENFEISKKTAKIINEAKKEGKCIVAVGTTTVRTLETCFQKYGEIKARKDSSCLFIYPPYEFKVVDKLLTNFHLPKSTLLMLVSAFSGGKCNTAHDKACSIYEGRDFIFEAYRQAIENKYRFYSYGDCMFIE